MYFDSIKTLINENNYDKAIEQIEFILKDNPSNDEAYYFLGKIYQRQLKWDNAITAYNKAIDLNKDSKAVTALEMLYDILNSMNNKIIET